MIGTFGSLDRGIEIAFVMMSRPMFDEATYRLLAELLIFLIVPEEFMPQFIH
jgi:hypothetical protein